MQVKQEKAINELVKVYSRKYTQYKKYVNKEFVRLYFTDMWEKMGK